MRIRHLVKSRGKWLMLTFVQIFLRDKGVISAVVVRTSENQFAPANLLGLDKFRQVAKIIQFIIYFFLQCFESIYFYSMIFSTKWNKMCWSLEPVELVYPNSYSTTDLCALQEYKHNDKPGLRIRITSMPIRIILSTFKRIRIRILLKPLVYRPSMTPFGASSPPFVNGP
jgi:hypothetical protein